MEQKAIEVLTRKFEKKDIKQRQGSFGKKLDYIEGHRIIQRLNEAFNHNWSFEVITPLDKAVIQDSVIVHVRLVIPGEPGQMPVVKDGIGGKKLTKVRGKDEYLDLSSDFKAATTDALKKAATTLGIALDLYGSDESDDDAPKSGNAAPAVTAGPQQQKLDVDDPNKLASKNQINAIESMSKGKKVKIEDLLTQFKVKSIADLKESVAKEIIVFLNNK